MPELLKNLSVSLTDILIYGAIAVVALIGLVKCILPVRACARLLRRGVRQLEVMAIKDGARPVWQEATFLGRPLLNTWRRFLVNAEQLDARGINCDVADYINDDTVIYQSGHTQLADIVPGILTSLGILGTFIGLVRGLEALDLSNAENIMTSISDMIGGMTFAFATSIAGISCSLAFNIINRASVGAAQSAIDDFHEAFTEFVMQQPLNDNVQAICQQEDRAAFLRRAVNEIGLRVSEGMTAAVEHSFAPVVQSMNNFIMGETQLQLSGLDQIINAFIHRMNTALDGQFMQLGQTLSAINQTHTVDYESLNNAMAAATGIMQSMQDMGAVMQQVISRFEGYVGDMADVRENQDAFAGQTGDILQAMHAAAREQSESMLALRAGQEHLQTSMQEYAQWSGRVLEAVREQADAMTGSGQAAAQAMRESGGALSANYASFVENISAGLSRSMALFEENMRAVVNLLDGKLERIEKAARSTSASYDAKAERLNEGTEGLLTTLSKMQRALGDITDMIERAASAGSPATEDA